MDIDCAMLPNAFDISAVMAWDILNMMHLDPLRHLIYDLHTKVSISNDEEIIDVENVRIHNWAVNFPLLDKEHLSVDVWCNKPDQDHEILLRTMSSVQRLCGKNKSHSELE